MGRKLIVAGLATGLLAVSAVAAGAKATDRSCASIGGEYLKIRVTNTTCKVAKQKVIFYEMQGESPPGWSCTFKRAGNRNSDATCTHNGGQRVSYVFHG